VQCCIGVTGTGARNRSFEIGPRCRASHTFDLTFDPSVFDMFVTWGSGATLVCPLVDGFVGLMAATALALP
jgi:hypothetical protein